MGRVRLSALIALFTALAGAQDVTFRSDVQLVRVLVTAKDNNGQLVAGLNKEDFRLTDNGVPQQITLFERESAQPLSIAVLVDASGSTHKDFKYEADSVERFFRAVISGGNPEDAVSLYSFNWMVQQISGFTRRIARLQQRTKEIKSEAGTAMYDALYFASRDLQERPGRHVIVLVTDGGDTTSGKTYQEALEALHGADAVLYAVLVVPITNDAGRNIGGENALTTMSQQLGGRVFAPSLGASLDQTFTDILRELRTQYLLGFYPQNVPLPPARLHQLRVTPVRPDLHLTYRTGYYGDSAAGPAPSPRRPNPRSREE